MIYRKLDANGDYTFGKQNGNFWINTPEAVGQAVMTRLKLFAGEWFLDPTVGVPYDTEILGMGTVQSYDEAIKSVILDTFGVVEILEYVSGVNSTTRQAVAACTISTIYGTISPTITYAFQNTGGQLLDINFTLDQSFLG